jgi:hypothetical protein
MKTPSTKILEIILAAVCAHAASAIDVSVDARCNIYGAGHPPPNDAPTVGPHGGGVAPVLIPLAALGSAPALQLRATGLISFCPSCGLYGPDGANFLSAAPAYNGISGITNFPGRSLVAVFTTETEPANPAPSPLDFTVIGTNYATLAPQLQQVFFIGSGLAATVGTAQVIRVPVGATKLYLGLVDGYSYADTPDGYDDNTGSFSATVTAALSLGIEYTTGKPRISVFGPIGSTNWIEYATVLPTTNWIPLTNVVLTELPTLVDDPSSSGTPARFYRAFQGP